MITIHTVRNPKVEPLDEKILFIFKSSLKICCIQLNLLCSNPMFLKFEHYVGKWYFNLGFKKNYRALSALTPIEEQTFLDQKFSNIGYFDKKKI